MKINQFDPCLEKEDLFSLLDTIQTNWLTEGKKTQAFQEILKDYCGVKHAILLPNGTLSLFVALKVLHIGPGDEVVVPDFTFMGSATSVILAGATPVLVDVNIDDFNIALDSVQKAISKKTRAIMPVHIYGQAADMDGVMKIANAYDLKVIEDTAQGIGVTFKGRHVGTLGDIGCLSFFADKTVTTGEGGAVLINDDKLAEKVMYFKNQGRLQRGSFIHPQIGYNFRLTDLQAALAINQMKRLGSIIKRKLLNEELYKKHLKGIKEVEFSRPNGFGQRVPFRVNILVPDPERLMKYLQSKDIGTRRVFYPLHKQPCFNSDNSRSVANLTNADKIFAGGLSLPSGLSLSDEQIKYVCEAVRQFYQS